MRSRGAKDNVAKISHLSFDFISLEHRTVAFHNHILRTCYGNWAPSILKSLYTEKQVSGFFPTMQVVQGKKCRQLL